VAKDKKKSERNSRKSTKAYEVLSDTANRRKYDELGANWKSGANFVRRPARRLQQRTELSRRPRGSHEFEFGNTGFSSFFEQLFGARGRGGAAGAPDFSKPCPRRRGDILVTLEEASRRRPHHHRPARRPHRDASGQDSPGIQDGQKLRVSGRDQNGGDLFLNIRLGAIQILKSRARTSSTNWNSPHGKRRSARRFPSPRSSDA